MPNTSVTLTVEVSTKCY